MNNFARLPQALRTPGRLAGIGLMLALCGSGCLRHMHPIDPSVQEARFSPQSMPRCQQARVHVFILHGTDPLDCANLAGLRCHLVSLGYHNTSLGQFFHAGVFRERICDIHHLDPQARFVVLGFSAGANTARAMVNRLQDEDGIAVDLLVYMGGNTLKDEAAPGRQTRPESAAKVVNILASGHIWHGCVLHDAENIQYLDVGHFGSPCHPQTIALLERELRAVALRVPQEVYRPPAVEPSPTPRPLPPRPDRPRGEWDFLKPTDHLRAPDEPPD